MRVGGRGPPLAPHEHLIRRGLTMLMVVSVIVERESGETVLCHHHTFFRFSFGEGTDLRRHEARFKTHRAMPRLPFNGERLTKKRATARFPVALYMRLTAMASLIIALASCSG